MNKNNLFDVDSLYAMTSNFRAQFAGGHIPSIGNLVSTVTVRIQILIPDLNTENFYRLSAVDQFSIWSLENNKLKIEHDPYNSVTLLLIRKPRNSSDDITQKAEITFPIDSISASDFILKNSILDLNKCFNIYLPTFLTYDTNEKDDKVLERLVNKEKILNITDNIKNKLNGFLNKVQSRDLEGLILEYDHIETYSLKGIMEAIEGNEMVYQAKNNFENLHKELQDTNEFKNKKIKL
jgi:hypothetical protein